MGAASSSQAMAPRNGGVTNEAITSMRIARAQGHVGARHDPAHRRGDEAADDADGRGDDERRQQRLDESGVGEEREEVGERRRCAARSVKAKTTSQPIGSTIEQAQRGGERRHHRAGRVEAGGANVRGRRWQRLDGHGSRLRGDGVKP